MKKLKLQLQNLDSQIHLLQSKRQIIIEKIQKKCKHPRIKKSSDNVWQDQPDHSPFDTTTLIVKGWCECLDCGKFFIQDESKQTKI